MCSPLPRPARRRVVAQQHRPESRFRVVAPQEFKSSLTAPEAAAMARGARRALPGARLQTIPLADGGPGAVEAPVPAGRIAGSPCGVLTRTTERALRGWLRIKDAS
jgi:Glycerate kinase family